MNPALAARLLRRFIYLPLYCILFFTLQTTTTAQEPVETNAPPAPTTTSQSTTSQSATTTSAPENQSATSATQETQSTAQAQQPATQEQQPAQPATQPAQTNDSAKQQTQAVEGPTVPPPCPENANCQVDPICPDCITIQPPAPPPPLPPAPLCERTIVANVVAFDQVYYYNRFGAFNPAGMMYALRRDVVGSGPGNVQLRADKRPRPLVLRVNEGDCLQVNFTNLLAPTRRDNDSTFTRNASVHVNGLDYVNGPGADDGANVGKNNSSLATPGETKSYKWYAAKQGQYLMYSMGAPVGGEGDGGQLDLGLFGSVNVEPKGAKWYRSQVTAAQLQAATTGRNPNGTPKINYEATYPDGSPVLNMLQGNEIIYSDLNALITGFVEDCALAPPSSTCGQNFREFTVLFHDEIKAVQAFPELEEEVFHGVRDGFAINYGSGAMGPIILANRKKIGPAANCSECKYEEFFLESHPNNDPALLVRKDSNGRAVEALFPDDPSNVHHSYLNDPVRFRNLHAGPKETHVFHLHAHQWLQSPRDQNSTYLDSQTISPGASFTYEINYGGSGNRNINPGDAIFHCHLYPHFAQGMWELWRNHDAFESGTPDRNLPDAEIAGGTPNPAIVPLPDRAMPPMPTEKFKGYPFYIAAQVGHRAPQPPLDMEWDGGLPRNIVLQGETVDGQAAVDAALLNDPVASRVRTQNQDRQQFLFFFARKLVKAQLQLLPQTGTPDEVQAMNFHQGLDNGSGVPGVPFPTGYEWPAAAYPSFTAMGTPAPFLVNGRAPQPGAPYADPCLPGTPLRRYRAAYIQFDMTINRAGWHDRQARIATLESDALPTLRGERKAEPLYFRANSGDCVTFSATNLVPSVLNLDDFQIFTPTDIIGQHIHLVKFDVTSSDGAGNGWNYEDGTFSPDEVRERIAANNAFQQANGGTQILTARPHPVFGTGTNNAFLGAQTTIQRWWADPLLNLAGQDRTIRTVFTHDHFGPSSHQHHGLYAALVTEPTASTWTMLDGQPMATRPDGGPTSFAANVVPPPTAAPEQNRPYREFNLAFADFAIVYTPDLQPVNPPGFMEAPLPIAVEGPPFPKPESISAADPGTQLINYRNEPIPHRIGKKDASGQFVRDANGFVVQKTDPSGDMSNVFNSNLHGDPYTPILPVFENERVQVRLIQGAQEEQHVFNVHGFKWLFEPSAPNSGYRNAQQIGISEHFEFLIEPSPLSPVTIPGVGTNVIDHLYSSAATDNLWDGQWGILRTFQTTTGATFTDPTTEQQRPLAPLPGTPSVTRPSAGVCPAGAPARQYSVTATLARDVISDQAITYNRAFGIKDPNAIMFIANPDLFYIRNGSKKPEPLMLRANAGDCITVTLTNNLPAVVPEADSWNEVPPIVNKFNFNQIKTSNRVGLHPQLVEYNEINSDGARVGFNPDTTVGPGQSITYTWYAGGHKLDNATGAALPMPIEFGATGLRDMGDVIKHSSHGAIGSLIIEPAGSVWADPIGTMNSNSQINVYAGTSVGGTSTLLFREFVVLYQDDLSVQQNGVPLKNVGGEDDSEDTGFKGFNYKSEPLWARLGLQVTDVPQGVNDKDLSNVLSSTPREPETPIFTATAGSPVRFRVLHVAGHPRQHGFTVFGHHWQFEPWQANSTVQGTNPFTFEIGSDSGIGPTRHLNILTSAGGLFYRPGDYLYRTQESFQFTNGLWGIFRVLPR